MGAIPGLAGIAFWEKYLVAFTLGEAAGPALAPFVQALTNAAWGEVQNRPLNPVAYAEMEAKSVPSSLDYAGEARKWGLDGDRFDALVQTVREYPELALALTMWRREDIDETTFRGWLHYLGFSDTVIGKLETQFFGRLSPAEVGNAVQQGHIKNDGILPQLDPTITFPPNYSQPTAPDDTPPDTVPLTQIDTIAPIIEAQANAIDEQRLKVIANLAGLPPGPEALLSMWNRNLIDEPSVDAGIREGHMKTKWARAYKRMRWAVLSAETYAGLWLRGWINETQANQGGALTGHTPEQMTALYRNRGRPLAPVQAFTAMVRKAPSPKGGTYPEHAGPFDENDFRLAIERSDVRTEYVATLLQSLYAYPSLFQLNRLVAADAISADVATEWAVKDRYAPEVVTALSAYWHGLKPGAVADPYVTKAQTQLWSRTHTSYVNGETDDAAASSRLAELHIPGAAQAAVLALWSSERDLIRKQLTPAQIKKAFLKASKNYATNAPWTRDDALAALVAQGYSAVDANDFLDIPAGP